MNIILNDLEVRVLGSLVEKQITTPDYYPLTLNSLTTACNQKSNRDPVVLLDDTEVVRGIDSLREKGFAQLIEAGVSRVPKYQHIFAKAIGLNLAETAILCELMLRGAQTLGELKTRASRMHEFAELSQVEETLKGLSEREYPLVVKLPRLSGQKESRFMHTISGMPDLTEQTEHRLPPEPARLVVLAENERLAKCEQELTVLKAELADLNEQFAEFKKQFE